MKTPLIRGLLLMGFFIFCPVTENEAKEHARALLHPARNTAIRCNRPHQSNQPPKAASSMATAASLQSSMASIRPSAPGRMVRMKNSAVFIWPA